MTKNTLKLQSDKTTIIGLIACVVIAIIIVLLLAKGCTKKTKYTITFDPDNGQTVTSVTVNEGDRVEKPTDPIKDGHTFIGWYDGDMIFDFEIKINDNYSLKAKWNSETETDELVLDETELTMMKDDMHKLMISKLPDGVEKSDLIWASSDEDVVTVDEEGNLKAIKDGKATITIKTKDGKYSVSCEVTVSADAAEVESISIDGSTQVSVGKTIKLSVKYNPSNAINKGVTWKSSNTSVATVDENGNVKGKKAGTARITATSSNGKSATIIITVKGESSSEKPKPDVAVTGIKVTGDTKVAIGSTIELKATIEPSDATNKNVTWKSEQTNIATVDENGKVKGVAAGKVKITATSNNGKSDSIEIEVVTVPVDSVSISGPTSVYVDESIQLKVSIQPGNATNQKVTWSSKNTEIATVDANTGKVTGKAEGTAEIVVTTDDGQKTATYKVTVEEKPAKYEFVLTPEIMAATGGISQYHISVTKDGVDFNGYTMFEYKGQWRPRQSGTIEQGLIDKSVTKVQLRLNNGKTVEATVRYVE